jgi:hypothetical protein
MSNAAPHPNLTPLEPPIGDWDREAVVEGDVVMRGRSTFAWAEQGAFLVQTADGEAVGQLWEGHLPFPTVSITGYDDSFDRYSVLYADARGVQRIYSMTFADGVLRQQRNASGFHQRFTGKLSADASRIDASWERSEDGEDWFLDFELNYTRAKRVERR